MARKSRRRHRPSRHLPLTFAPFARSMALLQASKKVKRRHPGSVFEEKFTESSLGNSSGKDDSLTNNSLLSNSSSDESEGFVQADFVFADPKPSDFHGVKLLLQTYLDAKEWDLSGFVDIVLGQTTVGSVVKVEDDEDEGVYGFVTALSMGRYKDLKCFKELREYLIKACQEGDVLSRLRLLLVERAHTTGLLVSQRVVNFPPQLLPHLYDAVFDEVTWATEDEPTEEFRNSFCFEGYIVVCKIYKRRNAHKGRGQDTNADDDVIYTKPEDEIFHELKDYRLTGLVMGIDASKISTFRKKLHTLINES